MNPKYEVGQVAEVNVGHRTIKGRIDWAAWDGDKHHYLIEWIDNNAEHQSRWFEEDR